MINRIFDNPITSWSGLVILVIGAALLGFSKITWEQFLLFLSLAGLGAVLKDPKKDE